MRTVSMFRMLARGRFLSLPLIAALVACGSAFDPEAPLTGTWSAPPFGDNSTLVLHLRQVDSTVFGGGAYTVKVYVDTVQRTGPTYDVRITGTYGSTVSLVMQYRLGPGTAAMAFGGVLDDPEHLRGILDFGGDRRDSVTFTRR